MSKSFTIPNRKWMKSQNKDHLYFSETFLISNLIRKLKAILEGLDLNHCTHLIKYIFCFPKFLPNK